jgi:lysophospholipase L1-like esterase
MALVHRTFALLIAAFTPLIVGCAPDDGVEAVASRGFDVAPAETTVDGAATERGAVTDTGSVAEFEVAPDALDDPGGPDEPEVPVETLVEPVIERPRTVAVVGDSLTRSAEEEILAALTASGLRVLTVDGLESRRMANGSGARPAGTDAIDNIQQVVEPDLWVIALGTNDVAATGTADEFRNEMREVLALIPDDVPVVWVDLWIRDRTTAIVAANQSIRDELRRWRGGSAVVDWYSHGDDDGIIVSDGVHLTATGQQLFADSIVETIDELFQT